MRILYEIIKDLGFEDVNKDYFDYTQTEREHIVSVLWDAVYGDFYQNSLKGLTQETPLEIHYNILDYLNQLKEEKEYENEFEVCDVIVGLINATETKTRKLDKDYANSNKEDRRK